MEAAGFAPEDYAHEQAEIWECNLQAFQFFRRIGTRWVVGGMGGVTGIRWEAVYPLMDRLGLDAPAWDALLSDLEVMEQAALVEINRKDE